MKLSRFAKEVAALKKTFTSPEDIDVVYIDKTDHKHHIESIDACFYGTAEHNKLTVILYEENPKNHDLPF